MMTGKQNNFQTIVGRELSPGFYRRRSILRKYIFAIIWVTLAAILMAACGLSSTAKLAEIDITIDGDPTEWTPFPVVHQDPEGDNISIELDISTVKAFVNSEDGVMYLLVESNIPIQEFSSLELDLQYSGELYRVAYLADGDTPAPAIMAHRYGEDEWDEVTDLYGSLISVDSAIEFSFPVDKFTNPETLKIVDLRVMGGICCNEFEWYAIDYIKDSVGIER
jgi:hypothetical protein